MKKSEKIILLGKSGVGKDYLMRKLIQKGLRGCVKMTTRPARKHEVQGVSYNFVNEQQFAQSIKEDKFLTYQSFNVTPDNREAKTWYYGLTHEEFNQSQVFIMTPAEFSTLSTRNRKDCFVVYLDIDRSIRESRLIKREDQNDSVRRRLDADEIDFIDFKDYDLRIRDHDFTVEDIWDLMD